jgi:hypothetical protein
VIGHARMIAGKTWIVQNNVTECYDGFEALCAVEHEEIDLRGGIARIPVDTARAATRTIEQRNRRLSIWPRRPRRAQGTVCPSSSGDIRLHPDQQALDLRLALLPYSSAWTWTACGCNCPTGGSAHVAPLTREL